MTALIGGAAIMDFTVAFIEQPVAYLTMAIAIGFSAINALTLSPALCAIFLKPHNKEDKEEKERLHNRQL